MAWYTRQSAAEIVTAQTIEASDFNNEYNAIKTAFDNAFNTSTGHDHSGSGDNGPKIDLSTSSTGTLGVAQGGTGVTSLTDGGIILGSGTSAVTVTGQPTNGQILIGSTSSDPVLATITEGEGIDVTNGAGTITLAGEDASDTNKGIASFASGDFSVSSGAVSLGDDVVRDVSTDSGAVTPATHTVTIAGGEGIDTSGSGATVTITGEDASDTNKGIVELATTAETNAGSDTGRSVTPDGLAASYAGTKEVIFNTNDFTADLATGDGQGYIYIPAALSGMNLVSAHAEVITAGTTGTLDIQIHNVTQTADMFSTKLTIDSGETGSDTAATPVVIDTANDDVTTHDILRLDIDAVHTTAAKGLIVTLEFRLP